MSFTGKFLLPPLLLLSWMVLSSQCFADSGTDLRNNGGTLSVTTAGPSLSGSILNVATGFNGGGTFAGGGRVVAGNGTNGIPNGVLFSGTFSGPLTWVIRNLTNGTHNYTLTGLVSGTMGGKPMDGVRSQSVPEPSTFALFGAGTFILGGVLRRKVLAAR